MGIRASSAGILAAASVLAVAAVSVAGVSDPDNGRYTGKTKQQEKVSFKVKNGTVKNPKFGVKLGGCGITTQIHSSDNINSKGKFSVSGGGSQIKGKFVRDDKAKGKVSFEFNSLNCPFVSGTQKKSAKFTASR